jgi:hypothetical protein
MSSISRPTGLDDTGWEAIEERRARLERAMSADDSALAVGAAKEPSPVAG